MVSFIEVMVLSKVKKLSVHRDRKEGKVTSEVLHNSLGKWIESGALGSLIIIYIDTEGYLSLGYTEMYLSELIGRLDIAKDLAKEIHEG